jgi:acetolactate synthase small subunit
VGPTENPAISKMQIDVNVEGHALEQVISQLDKLINVISIKEILPTKVKPAPTDTQPDYQN